MDEKLIGFLFHSLLILNLTLYGCFVLIATHVLLNGSNDIAFCCQGTRWNQRCRLENQNKKNRGFIKIKRTGVLINGSRDQVEPMLEAGNKKHRGFI